MNLRVMETGKMNVSSSPTVAPLNSKATHTVVINIAIKITTTTNPILTIANLKLSKVKGLAEEKTRPLK
jgi:hypothetical protein